MRRLLVNIITTVCAILCVALVALWVRSYSRAEYVSYGRIVDRRAGVTWVHTTASVMKGVVEVQWQTNHLPKGPPPEWVEVGGWRRETHPAGEFVFGWLERNTAADPIGFAWGADSYHGADGSFMKFRRGVIPIWAAVVVVGVVPAVRGFRRWRRVRPGCCARCGYDLTANESGVCPECGCVVRPATARRAGSGNVSRRLTS